MVAGFFERKVKNFDDYTLESVWPATKQNLFERDKTFKSLLNFRISILLPQLLALEGHCLDIVQLGNMARD